jgi:hypothetical protein
MTTQTAQKVADLTIDEFRALVREIVAEVVEELIDPDEGLEVRPEFIEEMERRLASDEPTIPAEEVYLQLGLD